MTGGWLALLLIGGATLVALRWLGGVRGPALQLACAALLVGATGYAQQGRPSLPAAPAADRAKAAAVPLTDMRHRMFGKFTAAERWLTIAESYAGRGDTYRAVGVLRSAVREHPRDAILWTGLGNALADHGRGLNPAAELAFERAAVLAPDHPGPPFFAGLAAVRSGDAQRALRYWRPALAMTPPAAPWREGLEQSIAELEKAGR